MTVSELLHSLLDYKCLLRDWLSFDLQIGYFFGFLVHWLTLHSWTLNFWILLQLNYDSHTTVGWLPSIFSASPLL
jgi:hypothetical protein